MARITNVTAREVLDSRGNPTVEAELICDDGSRGSAIAPSGASTGRAEACELRDGDSGRYDGRGVRKAVANVKGVIRDAVIGMDAQDQFALDERMLELDGTPQKTNLGANALLAVSLAAAHAAAASEAIPLFEHLHRLVRRTPSQDADSSALETAFPAPRMPLPMVNMISGGLHAGGNLDFQDFLIQPVGSPDFATGLEWVVRVYRRLGEVLNEHGYESHLVGDEGGYGPKLTGNRQAAEMIVRAIEAAGLQPGEQVTLALDVAASHFYDGRHYFRVATDRAQLDAAAMIEELEALVCEFPITSIEDPLAEDDWEGWRELVARLGSRVHVVGDDLLVTNVERVRQAIERSAADSVLVKVNQIGTLSEAFQTMRLARAAGMRLVVSARSGETEDTTIADLAVGVAAEQIKIGSIVRSERLAKYNRLLRIESMLAGV